MRSVLGRGAFLAGPLCRVGTKQTTFLAWRYNMMTENENAGPRAGVSYTLLPLLSAIVVVMNVMMIMPFVLTAFSADVLTVNPMVPKA